MKDFLRKLLPFELKRGTSIISVIIALVTAGILSKLGELILTGAIQIVSKILPGLGETLLAILFFKFEVNVLAIVIGLLIFVLLLFPVYRHVDRILLSRMRRELIYEDHFTSNAGWNLNYWGTTNPSKTNRIENSQMIFEATPAEVTNQDGKFGAFYDLKNGIYFENSYQVSCFVRSSGNATMGFQLWLHDTKEHAQIFTPDVSTTPPENGKEISLQFKATQTNAVRIHLHCTAGEGRIIVERVSVYKIDGTNAG